MCFQVFADLIVPKDVRVSDMPRCASTEKMEAASGKRRRNRKHAAQGRAESPASTDEPERLGLLLQHVKTHRSQGKSNSLDGQGVWREGGSPEVHRSAPSQLQGDRPPD